MPPKKSGATTAKKGSVAPAAHASYQDMIKEAIISLKDRTGSSRQRIKTYVKSNNPGLKNVSDGVFTSNINRALAAGVEQEVFEQPKGPSGPVKLNKTAGAKPAATTKKEPKPAAKATPKKTTKAAPKAKAAPKTATKKPTAKAAPKKAAAKPKANAGRPRKAPAVAPAVEEKPTVLTKTKSGRITKTRAPEKKPARKAPAKRAAPKKATPKKATPKKAEA